MYTYRFVVKNSTKTLYESIESFYFDKTEISTLYRQFLNRGYTGKYWFSDPYGLAYLEIGLGTGKNKSKDLVITYNTYMDKTKLVNII